MSISGSGCSVPGCLGYCYTYEQINPGNETAIVDVANRVVCSATPTLKCICCGARYLGNQKTLLMKPENDRPPCSQSENPDEIKIVYIDP